MEMTTDLQRAASTLTKLVLIAMTEVIRAFLQFYQVILYRVRPPMWQIKYVYGPG